MSEDLSSGWPKPWSEITNQSKVEGSVGEVTNTVQFKDHWVEYQDGVRGYNGTLYVSESVGRETEENVDEWMPFEVYVVQKS